MYSLNRRSFLRHSVGLVGLLTAIPVLESCNDSKSRAIVLRSSWQVENIGDIAHTPGVLALIERYLPHVSVRLWPTNVGSGVEEMLMARFPKLKILKSEAEKEQAMRECDFMLHGSGPSLVGRRDLDRWRTRTGKPYGIYGITFPGVYGFEDQRDKYNPLDIDLFNGAMFSYFRDSVSLAFAKAKGARCPVMGYCPDGAFAVDVKNDAAAESFLKAHGLETGKFACVIAQYRFTPWWELPTKNPTVDERKNAWNQKMKEHDNAPVRQAIIEVVKQTDLKVLIVPENQTEIRIGKEMLYDPLPADIKTRVVWRDSYWLTDEAVSTYARSAGFFGLEMHSPIMCIAQGVPAIVCRFAEQTSKGFMWKDIGLDEWLFDMDHEQDVSRLVPTVLEMLKNPEESKRKVLAARKRVSGYQQQTMGTLEKSLNS